MLVRVLCNFEHPGGEARLQLPQVLLDVAADHEDRGGNLKFLVKFRDLREKDGCRILRHFPADPFLARRASGDAFHIVTDNQR